MDLSAISLCVAIGLLAGSLSGLVGIGGGIVMVPLMVFLFGMSQHQAQGTTLAVLPAGLLSLWIYYKSGNVNIPVAVFICAGFMIGGYFGAKFAINIPAATLRKVFGFVMLIVSIKLLIGK